MSAKNSSSQNIVFVVVVMALVAAVTTLIVKHLIDLRDKNEFITEEGKAILSDKQKRANLNKAIDEYKEKGNWDALESLGT